MENQPFLSASAEPTAFAPSPHRAWQDQALPAPLISYEQAEVVALGLLRRRPQSAALVGISQARVIETLRTAGISTTPLLFTGRDQLVPDLVLQTNPAEAEAFDLLHAQILSGPQSPDPDAATWLRQRRLAHLRLLALGGDEAAVFLPDVDALWQPPTHRGEPQPNMLRWIVQALPLLLVGGVAMIVYIYNAGVNPDLWPLFVLPLLGACGFGYFLFYQLWSYRQSIATAWLARPARLRPDTTRTARELARRPWLLLYLPVALVLGAFVLLFVLLASSVPVLTTVGSMVWPLIGAMILLLGLTYVVGRRYLRQTRALVQHLPAPLLPVQVNQLWLSFLYY